MSSASMSESIRSHPERRGRQGLRVSVAGKILSVVVLAGIAMVALGVYVSVTLQHLGSDADHLASIQKNVSTSLSQLKDALWKVRQTQVLVAAYPADQKQKQLDALHSGYDTLDAAMTTFDTAYTDAAGAQPTAWADFTSNLTAWRQRVDQQLMPAAMANNQKSFATIRDGAGSERGDQMVSNLTDVETQVAATMNDIDAQASHDVRTGIITTILAIVVALLITTTVGIVVATGIRRSVGHVKETVDAMSRGDLTVVPTVRSSDELGEMAGEMTSALGTLRDLVGGVVETAQTVASSSEELSAAGVQVSAGAEETSTQSGVVAAAAEQVSRNIQAVAAGAEQMGASIREIAQNATEAVKVAARETAKATDDIARRVEAIQADTSGAVSAIDEIASIITSINDHQGTIASAVEEQTATTNEMSRSVNEAAQGAGEIASNITGVATSARTTSETLTQVHLATTGLAELATGLQSRVAAFTV